MSSTEYVKRLGRRSERCSMTARISSAFSHALGLRPFETAWRRLVKPRMPSLNVALEMTCGRLFYAQLQADTRRLSDTCRGWPSRQMCGGAPWSPSVHLPFRAWHGRAAPSGRLSLQPAHCQLVAEAVPKMIRILPLCALQAVSFCYVGTADRLHKRRRK
jgi:hypothetical protein